MIAVGAVPLWASFGHGERVELGAGDHSVLSATLSRWGATVVTASDPPPDVGFGLVGAPRHTLGPDRVRAWRAWVARGGRLLLVVHEGSDALYLLRGLDYADDTAAPSLSLRSRARFIDGEPGLAGRLWPSGKGWFRFGRSLDVLLAISAPGTLPSTRDPRWSVARLTLGRGQVTVVADPASLGDEALAELPARDALITALHGWLPAPEPRLLAERVPDLLAHPAFDAAWHASPDLPAMWDALHAGTLDPALRLAPERLPALRALGERGLAAAGQTGAVGLTSVGREQADRVRALLGLRAWLRWCDRQSVQTSTVGNSVLR